MLQKYINEADYVLGSSYSSGETRSSLIQQQIGDIALDEIGLPLASSPEVIPKPAENTNPFATTSPAAKEALESIDAGEKFLR